MGDLRFDYKVWKNPHCYEHFKRSIDNGNIKVLKNLSEQLKVLKNICEKPEKKPKKDEVKKQQKNSNKQQKK